MRSKYATFFLRPAVILAFLWLIIFGAAVPASASSVIFVKYNAAGLNNGTSWKNAYKNLQVALKHASSGKQIWVAKGTYYPTAGADRSISFTLKNGVAIYGGFAGSETLLNQRHINVNVTTLSGDIGTHGVVGDNTYEVVNGSGSDTTAILDGFTIVGGNANAGVFPGDAGGGVFLYVGSPTLRNLIIRGNTTNGYGGGLFNDGGKPTLTNVHFSGNTGTFSGDGGGMYNWSGGAPKLTNVTFSGNTSDNNGGGLYNSGSNPTLINVRFSGNTAATSGGGMYSTGGKPKLTDVTFSTNTATNSNGGGMDNENGSNAMLTNVAFSLNTASAGGGGLYNLNSSPTLLGVTFNGNNASNGGGEDNYQSNVTIKNATFKSNTAGSGGGMYNYSSSPSLSNLTFSGNTAAFSGDGMYNDSSSPNISDSIFWGDGSMEIWDISPSPVINDSIVETGCPGSATCTNVSTSDPVLGPLANNGGFTKTMSLGAGSAAIDTGGAVTTCAATDQRGVKRPQGGGCDIGAYEVKVLTFTSVSPYDGWVLESAKGSNHGGSLDSISNTLKVGDDSANRRYRGILSFDTSPIPNAAAVVMAEVRVRQQSIVGNPFVTQGALMTDLVKPYFGSSLSLAASDWQAAATVTSAGSFLPDGSSYWTPLTGFARSNINKTGTTQFRLRFSTDAYNSLPDYLSLYSGSATTPSYRPRLIVYYNP